MATTSVTTKTVVIADDTAFVRDRFRTAVENAGHKAVAVKSAAELLARVRADLDPDRSDRPGPPAAARAGRGPGPVDSQAGRRAAAGADFQRDDCERRRSPRAGGARRRRLHQRIQRGAAHPAVDRAAPVPRQLQPPRQPTRRPRHPDSIPLRQHDRRGADAEPESRRDCDSHDQPARQRLEGQGAFPHAGIEARHRRRGARGLERSPRRDGHPVREGRARPTRR